MSEIWTVVSVAAAAFVATNMDNLLLLTGLLAASFKQTAVLSGYLLTALIVIVLSLVIALLGDVIDTRYVGFLGLLPVALGLRGMVSLIRGTRQISASAAPVTGVWPTVAVVLPMSGDSLAVYIPLLADTRAAMDVLIIATLSVCAVTMAFVSRALVSRPALRDRIGSAGAWIMPPLMIGIGAYVLLDTASDVLIR